MNKKSLFLIATAIGVMLPACVAGLLRAQDNFEFSSSVPPKPLVYIEFRDFGGDLEKLLDSEFAKSFVKSRAYSDFKKTKLANKLADRIAELKEATGFGLTVSTLREVAGGPAAVALYDIGELRLLFLTRIPADKLLASALWRMRTDFEERRANGINYFVKEDPDGRVSLAFTQVGDKLVAGTDINRFEACLRLLDGGSGSLAEDETFRDAFPQGFAFDDALLYLDQEQISETPHFRSYWIYGNQAELRSVKRVAISLSFEDYGISEKRWLTTARRKEPALAAPAQLASELPSGCDVYAYGYAGEGSEFSRVLATELFEDAQKVLVSQVGKAMDGSGPAGYGLATGARFDEDEFFLTIAKTFAVRLTSPSRLDRAALESALAGYYEDKLLQKGQGSFKFVERQGFRVLDVPLYGDSVPAYRISGEILTITNDAGQLLSGGLGDTSAQEQFVSGAGPGACRLVSIDATKAASHLSEYFKIVSQRSNWSYSANASFFWRNVISLFKTLEFVERIEIRHSWEEYFLVEEISYRFER